MPTPNMPDDDRQGYERAHKALTAFYSGPSLDPQKRQIAGPNGVPRPLAATASRVLKAKKAQQDAAVQGKIVVFDANGKLVGLVDPAKIVPVADGVIKTLGRRPSTVTRSDVFAALGRLTAVRKSARPAGRNQQVAAGVLAYQGLAGTDRAAVDRVLKAAKT